MVHSIVRMVHPMAHQKIVPDALTVCDSTRFTEIDTHIVNYWYQNNTCVTVQFHVPCVWNATSVKWPCMWNTTLRVLHGILHVKCIFTRYEKSGPRKHETWTVYPCVVFSCVHTSVVLKLMHSPADILLMKPSVKRQKYSSRYLLQWRRRNRNSPFMNSCFVATLISVGFSFPVIA